MMSQGGRGEEAVRDMRGRLAAGWTVEQLWDRYVDATFGDGFTYDFAEVSDESIDSSPHTSALQCA